MEGGMDRADGICMFCSLIQNTAPCVNVVGAHCSGHRTPMSDSVQEDMRASGSGLRAVFKHWEGIRGVLQAGGRGLSGYGAGTYCRGTT